MGKKNRKQLLRLKKRRHISSEGLFKKKAELQLFRMDWSIRQAFPDSVKRAKYIAGLIKGLEEEEVCPIT